jgi:hypothetical protein
MLTFTHSTLFCHYLLLGKYIRHRIWVFFYHSAPVPRHPVPPKPDANKTQHSQETDIHVTGGFRTHDPNKRAAADQRLRNVGHYQATIKEQKCVRMLNTIMLEISI